MKLALLLANRGFFPSTVIDSARQDMRLAAAGAGVELVEPDPDLTRYGAVETTAEGILYANFLAARRGDLDGLIICLPNFGDENGIKAAIRDIDVPVLLQAYPDEIGKMDFANRRDAFCGKLALTSVLKQMKFKYTSGIPFVMHPLSAEFARELADFAAICRIVRKMRHMRLGVFGARTTAFKSVRFDEIALESHGVDVESLDLAMFLARYEQVGATDPEVGQWQERLHQSADFTGAPAGVDIALARLGATFAGFVRDMQLDAMAIRCWSELQSELKITPCAVMGIFNQIGVPAACETDVTNAVAMMALSLASAGPAGCLDLNNNYGNDPDKCVLFHCGPLPAGLMGGRGRIEEHKMFVKTMGENCSWGLNVGRIKPGGITIAGMRTEDGQVCYFAERARITADPVEAEFFGTCGVMHLPGLQAKLSNMSREGFRHHAIIAEGDLVRPVSEALTAYLGYRQVDLHGRQEREYGDHN